MSNFMIQSNGLAIDITHALYTEGTPIQGFTPGGGGGNAVKPNQSWQMIRDPLGSAHHVIVSGASNLCIGIGANAIPRLDPADDRMDDATALTLQAQETINNNYQLWDFLAPTGGKGNAVFIQNPQTGYVIELQSKTNEISRLVVSPRLITNESYQLWTAVDQNGNDVDLPILSMAQLGAPLRGSSQYVLLPPTQGDHLVVITITIDIAADLVVQPGCSIQINCDTPYLGPSPLPQISPQTPPAQILTIDQEEFQGDTEDFDRQAQWMQFGLFMQNNQLALFNQFYHRSGPITPSEFPSQTAISPPMLTLQNNTIPTGTRIVMNICTDQNDFAIGMAGMVLDNTGMIMGQPVYWPAIGRDSFHSTIDGGKIHQRAMAPIGAFQVVFCSLPGQPGAQFTSGMGTITVTASPGIAAQNYWPNPFGGGTAENSNMPYDLVQSGASRLIAQPFGVPTPPIHIPRGIGEGFERGVIILEPGGLGVILPGDAPGPPVIVEPYTPGR
jgi:hypothetical protein